MSGRTVVGLQALRSATRTLPITGPGFFSTTSSLGHKESTSQTDIDYEKHKQDSLSKQKEGSGHWKPELASDSEEAVKADRSGPEDLAKLQERTKRAAEVTSKSGTSVRDEM